MHPHTPKADQPATWRDRLRALRNVPPLLKMVWETSPLLATATIALRLIISVIPVAQLWVGKLIIDQVVRAITGRSVNHSHIWVLLAYEIGLVVLNVTVATGFPWSAFAVGGMTIGLFMHWFFGYVHGDEFMQKHQRDIEHRAAA